MSGRRIKDAMKLNRSENTLRNARFALINKIISILGPFAVRTVFIHTLGAKYLGLNSLFTSILNVLNLTELGFGTAVVFNMYKAIADDDNKTISALLLFYKKIYRIVGTIITVIGLGLIPFLGSLINGTPDVEINIAIIYLIYLLNTVVSYFAFGYMGSLLSAFQRNDIKTKILSVCSVIMYSIQIIILITVRNYYIYIGIMPVFTIVENLLIARRAKKMFPQYPPRGDLENKKKAEIQEKVKGLLISNICGVSRNSFDSIFISMFLGLTEIAIYNNYYYIMNSVAAFVSIVINATVAGAGNSVASETPEKNYSDMMKMNFLYMWISGWCTVCLLCLYQQFMQFWAGPQLMLPISSVILICVYFYVLRMGDIRTIYSQACGLWWENRYRSLLEAATNIVLNYILGKIWGINGIIAATLISLFFINFCYGTRIIYKYYFKTINIKEYYVFHLMYGFLTIVICAVTYAITNILPMSPFALVLRIIVCIVVPNALYYFALRKQKRFKETIPWFLDRMRVKKTSWIYQILCERKR